MVSLRRSNRLDEVGPSSIYDLIRPFSIRPYLYRVRKYVLIASRIRCEKNKATCCFENKCTRMTIKPYDF